MAKAAQGLANDLASTSLLATDKKIIMAPAMNVRMWQHEATQRNLSQLIADGVSIIGPEEGDMACGEFGPGRMSEPQTIAAATAAALAGRALTAARIRHYRGANFWSRPDRPMSRLIRCVISPIAHRANKAMPLPQHWPPKGEVHLVSGPTALATPQGVHMVRVETAREMLAAVEAVLPVDGAVMTAAVADWRPTDCDVQKIKKNGDAPEPLNLTENPDILAMLAAGKNRPALLIGFAAETENIEAHATAKLAKKNCDWIVANNVGADSGIEGGVMGGEANAISLICAADKKPSVENFDIMSKQDVAALLSDRMAAHFASAQKSKGKEK